jgi:hypothetical protein
MAAADFGVKMLNMLSVPFCPKWAICPDRGVSKALSVPISTAFGAFHAFSKETFCSAIWRG